MNRRDRSAVAGQSKRRTLSVGCARVSSTVPKSSYFWNWSEWNHRHVVVELSAFSPVVMTIRGCLYRDHNFRLSFGVSVRPPPPRPRLTSLMYLCPGPPPPPSTLLSPAYVPLPSTTRHLQVHGGSSRVAPALCACMLFLPALVQVGDYLNSLPPDRSMGR